MKNFQENSKKSEKSTHLDDKFKSSPIYDILKVEYHKKLQNELSK